MLIKHDRSNCILTIGPDLTGKGGIASVLKYYHDYIYETWNFIPEAHNGSSKVGKLLQAAKACLKLYNTLLNNPEIKIVHIHTASRISFPRSCFFMSIAKRMGRKVVMHMHGCTFKDYAKGKETKISAKLRQADAVIALSDSWRDYFRNRIGCTNVVVIPNIVPPVKVQAISNVNNVNGIVQAVFLGQLGSRKGIYDLLAAINAVRNRLDGKFKLHVGGNGEVEKFLGEVKRLNLESIVSFEGWTTGDKKERLLQTSSISILPSYAEGLPISLLEGMAHSHALISTDVGGISEILDQSNGFILKPGDINALGESICRLVEDSKLRETMGRQSLLKAAPHLPNNVAVQLNKLYSSILQ